MSFTIPKQQKVVRQELANLPTPVKLGRLHQPISHSDLIESIQNEINAERGFKRIVIGIELFDVRLNLISESIGLLSSKHGMGTEMFANLQFEVKVADKVVEALDGKATYSLAVINSNAQKFALTFFAGAVIGVCTNGIIIKSVEGDVVKKKHITSMSSIYEIRRGLQSFVDSIRVIEEVAKIMQGTFITPSDLNDALVAFGKSKIMCPTMVFKTLDEYESAKHESDHGRETLWSLYNAGTEIIKRESGLAVQRRVMLGMTEQFSNLQLMPTVEEITANVMSPNHIDN